MLKQAECQVPASNTRPPRSCCWPCVYQAHFPRFEQTTSTHTHTLSHSHRKSQRTSIVLHFIFLIVCVWIAFRCPNCPARRRFFHPECCANPWPSAWSTDGELFERKSCALLHSFPPSFTHSLTPSLTHAHVQLCFFFQLQSLGMSFEQPPQPDVLAKDGQEFQVGNLTFTAMHTPGHCPGHLCFYEKAKGVLFSGDILFQGTVGRTGSLMRNNCAQNQLYCTSPLFVVKKKLKGGGVLPLQSPHTRAPLSNTHHPLPIPPPQHTHTYTCRLPLPFVLHRFSKLERL